MTTALIPYNPDFYGLEKAHLDFHTDQYQKNRRSMISEIRCISGLTDVVKSMKQDTLYKLVYPEGKLLQKAGNKGTYRGIFYGKKGIDKHAEFIKIRPSLIETAKAAGSQFLLISIAIQLNKIEQMVDNIAIEMHRDRIAEVHSGVDQFDKALLFSNPTHRSQAILNSIQTLHTGLRKTISELKGRIAEAPDADDRILDHIGRSKIKKATKIIGLAQEAFYATILGIKTLAECYSSIEETEAATRTLSDYFNQVHSCDIVSAAEKARLIQFTGPIAPQTPWEEFNRIHPTLQSQMQLFGVLSKNTQEPSIEIEFMPSEL